MYTIKVHAVSSIAKLVIGVVVEAPFKATEMVWQLPFEDDDTDDTVSANPSATEASIKARYCATLCISVEMGPLEQSVLVYIRTLIAAVAKEINTINILERSAILNNCCPAST